MSSPVLRRAAKVAAAAALSMLTLVVAIVALLQVPAVATWVANRLITLAPLNPGYTLEAGSVSGNWITALQLEEVRLHYRGRTLAILDRVQLGYDLRRLRGPDRRLRELILDGARLDVRRARDGWDIANAFRGSDDTTGGGGDFLIDRLQVRRVDVAAHFAADSTARVRGLTLKGRDLVVGSPLLLTMDTLYASVAPPGEPPLWFDLAAAGAATEAEIRLDPLRIRSHRSDIAGRMVLPRSFDDPRVADRLDVRLRASPLALADLASVYPEVPPHGDVRVTATASADGRLVTARLAARVERGTIELEGGTVVGQGAPAVYRLQGEVRDLDPSLLHRAAPIGVVTGEVEADLRGETLALADGTASLRLRGSRFGETDLRDLDLEAEVTRGRADLVLLGRVFEGSIRADGWARPFDSVPSYRLAGRATGLRGTQVVAKALSGDRGDPDLDIRFRFAGDGVEPREADVDGSIVLAAVGGGTGRVPLGRARFSLSGGRVQVRPDLRVAGGRVRAVATARLADTISYEIRQGTIEGVDVGGLMGDTVSAPVSGRFTLRGRGVSPEEALVTGRLELDEVRRAARRIERVIAQARLERGRARLEVRGALQGGRLAMEATASPFDSPITFVVRRAALDSVDVGTLLGRPGLAGPVTLEATGSGRWGARARAMQGRITIAPSRLGTVEVNEGVVDAELAAERLTYGGRLRTTAGSLTLEGTGRPFADIPSYTIGAGRAEGVDLGILFRSDSLTSDLAARFTGSLSGAALDSMIARLDLDLLPSRVNQAQLGPGRLSVGLDQGSLTGALRLQGEDAAATARLTGNLAPEQSRVRADGDLRMERLARWMGGGEADGRVEGRFGLDVIADSTGLVSVGGTVTAAGGLGDVRLHQLHVAMVPAPGAVQVDTLVVRSNVAVFDGAGRLALPGGPAAADTFRIAGRTGDLTPLTLLAGADSVALDSTLMDLTITGPADRRKIEGHADAFRLLYGDRLAERVTVRGTGMMDSTGLDEIAARLRVQGAAAGKVSVRQLDLVARYDSLVSVQGLVTVDDDIRLAIALQGRAEGDTTRATLGRLDLAEGGRTWRLANPVNVALGPGTVEVDRFALRAGDRQVAVDGIFDRRDSSDMTLRFVNVDLDALAEARLVPVAGRLDGSLRLSGPAAAPAVEGGLVLAVRRLGGESVGRLESNLAWTRTGLRLSARASPLEGGRLTAEGTLPWRLTLIPEDTAAAVGFAREPADTISLVVRSDSFDLGFFEPFLPEDAAQDLAGDLVVDARIAGTPDQPRASGTIDLRALAITLPAIGVTYTGGRIAGRLEGETLDIDTLRLATGRDEELLASGRVLLRPLGDPALDLTAHLDNFRVSNSDVLRSVATGQLRLGGTLAKPSLTGRLALGRTEIIADAGTGAAVEEVELTPADLQQLARNFGPAALAAADEGPGLVERFRIDLDVRFARQVWFRRAESPSIDIEIGGRINVRQQPGEDLEFFGQVEPIPGRGELNLYGRSFRLVEGTIALQGPAQETQLDVTAQYQVPTQGDADDEDVVIAVDARGRPDSLALEFSAEPSMPEEDIISYIVTGRPASDNPLVDQEGGGGVDATQLAIGQLAGNLGGVAGEELGFDVFQIRQEPARGLTLTAGRYLAPRVFVSLQQPLRLGATAEQQSGGALGPGFELEYSLNRWLRATLRGGSLPTSTLFRGRYAF